MSLIVWTSSLDRARSAFPLGYLEGAALFPAFSLVNLVEVALKTEIDKFQVTVGL
jgi:hypothetical protein